MLLHTPRSIGLHFGCLKILIQSAMNPKNDKILAKIFKNPNDLFSLLHSSDHCCGRIAATVSTKCLVPEFFQFLYVFTILVSKNLSIMFIKNFNYQ